MKLLTTLAAVACTLVAQGGTPILYNAFSHNDYSRPRPLQAALKLGFNCVEADSYYEGGRFVVVHDLPDCLDSLITLQGSYLEPLFARIDANGGSVYKGADRPFFLMVDIKRRGDEFYTALRPYLLEHKRYFTRYENGVMIPGPILLFFSGSRPLDTLPQEDVRLAFLDGQFADMKPDAPASLYPVVSDNYEDFFTWDGHGTMPADQLERLRGFIAKAHAQGRLIRLWGAPDTEAWARLQVSEGVDLIGTDDLPALHRLLTE